MTHRNRVLITGASGLLGASVGIELLKRQNEVVGIRRSHPRSLPFPEVQMDLLERNSLRELFRRFSPDCVVHAAALSKVIECEREPEIAHKQNVTVTESLLGYSLEVNAYFVFISTDQVFDGTKSFSSEADTPHPTHTYGRTKLKAEELVGDYKSSLVLRSNNIVGHNVGWGRSFTDGILSNVRRGERVELFADQFRSPIHLRAITSMICDSIERRIEGTLHAGGPERLSRFDTGMELQKSYSFEHTIIEKSWISNHPDARLLHVDGSFDISKLRTLFPSWSDYTIRDGFKQDISEYGSV